MPTPKETELVSTGDLDQFVASIEEHRQELSKYIRHLARDKDLAQELLHETIDRAVCKWRTFDPAKATGGLIGWLMKIAANRLYSLKREWKRDLSHVSVDVLPEDLHPATRDGPSEQYETRRGFAILRFRLMKLTATQQRALQLRFMGDKMMPPRQVAKVMGLSIRQTYEELYTGLRSLRKMYRVRLSRKGE